MTPPDSSVTVSNSDQATVRAHKRRLRKPISCEPCRKSKLRCDRQLPCNSCRRRNRIHACAYITTRSQSTPEPTESSSQLRNEHTTAGSATVTPSSTHEDGTSSAGAFTHERWEEVLQRPMDQIERSAAFTPHVSGFLFPLNAHVSKKDLIAMIPPPDCCDYLLSRFFLHQAPFFNILHGPTFQREYNDFVDNPDEVDLSWLALLFVILFIGVKSLEYDAHDLDEMWPGRSRSQPWNEISPQFIEAAMVCLSKNHFMTSYRLSSLQALLLMAYAIGHSEGVERAWTLLGIALNIAIALQCNLETAPSGLRRIEVERRRRCWAGLLSLYTYQAVSHPGLDMIFLTNDRIALPADVNDVDIQENCISEVSSRPTQMSVMMNKIRLFQLSTRICRYLRGPDKYDEATRDRFDAEIAEEQRRWDAEYLTDRRRNFLQFTSYPCWVFFQLHAHHLCLLIHQPFCRSRTNNSTGFRQQSRARCINSGAILLDLHRQLWECRRLRPFRWTMDGLISFYALHGAVALASCLLEDDPGSVEAGMQYREAFVSAVSRIATLQARSAICEKAYPILHQLQTLLFPTDLPNPSNAVFMDSFDTWVDNQQWLNFGTIDWNFFDGIVGENNGL
ncbi:hypothetical protein F5Y16DRAFT_405959 [Xylariaceae sp. FL0255]|nr:hypothetical protein F5Y16DRAFT_405959 [Xylariaceae sp. FL0255]